MLEYRKVTRLGIVEISDKTFHFLSLFQQIRIFTPYFAYNLLDFHNKVTTSETLISDYKVRSQVRNNVKSSLIMVYYLY